MYDIKLQHIVPKIVNGHLCDARIKKYVVWGQKEIYVSLCETVPLGIDCDNNSD